MKLLGRLLIRAIICALASASIGGFIAGYIHCSDCHSALERCFLGVIWAFLSPLAGGRIPQDGGSGAKIINTWEYGIPATLALFILWSIVAEFVRYRISLRREAKNRR